MTTDTLRCNRCGHTMPASRPVRPCDKCHGLSWRLVPPKAAEKHSFVDSGGNLAFTSPPTAKGDAHG